MSLILVMLTIIAVLIVTMLPRIYTDWVRFNHYCQEQDFELIKDLLKAENQWVMRHMICSIAAIVMVAAIKLNPDLQIYEQLSDIVAAYACISLMFAFIESIFAHRISSTMFRLVELAEGE